MKSQRDSRHTLKIFTGNAHPALAQVRFARTLRGAAGKAQVGRFPDGEVKLRGLRERARR